MILTKKWQEIIITFNGLLLVFGNFILVAGFQFVTIISIFHIFNVFKVKKSFF